MAVLTKRINDMTKGKSKKGKKEKEKSEKGLLAKSFNWDDEYVSSDDEGSTKIKAFMAIAKDEPFVGKADARSGQWVDIIMKKVHRFLSMTDADERKHVLNYTYIDLHYVEDQRKNLIRKVEGKRKSPPKRLFSLKMMNPHLCLHLRLPLTRSLNVTLMEPFPPRPKLIEAAPSKLIEAAPSGTLESLISLSELSLNMADLTLDTPDPKKTRTSVKVSHSCVIKKDIKISYCDHLTKEHLEHVVVKKTLSKLKAQLPQRPLPKKAPMIPKPFIECKYCRFNNHHSNHCEFYPGCEVCGSIAHEASDCPKKHPKSRRPRIANRKSEPTKKQEMEEIVHVIFNEDDEAISQSSTEGDAINFNENRSFPDDKFLEPRSKVSLIPEDPLEFIKGDNHPALNEPDQKKLADPFKPAEPQNNVIIKPIDDIQPSPTISPSAEVILQTHVPQDRWSRENHIELVNIIGEPLVGITSRSRIRS
nr:hypothetical protein [Tanacetum cinerariifolium]